MKEAVRDLLGVIGKVINFLFLFWLPQRIYIHSLFNKIDYVFINVNDEKKRLIYCGTSTEDLPEDLGPNWVNLGPNWVILPKQIMESKNIKDVFLKFNS